MALAMYQLSALLGSRYDTWEDRTLPYKTKALIDWHLATKKNINKSRLFQKLKEIRCQILSWESEHRKRREIEKRWEDIGPWESPGRHCCYNYSCSYSYKYKLDISSKNVSWSHLLLNHYRVRGISSTKKEYTFNLSTIYACLPRQQSSVFCSFFTFDIISRVKSPRKT